jgi:hypothetical protein
MTRCRHREDNVMTTEHTDPSEATNGMLRLECAYCHAAPGQWCKTAHGWKSGPLHAARFWAYRDLLHAEAGTDEPRTD